MVLISPFNLGFLDGGNGFILEGIDEFDYSGRTVSSAGDVNGDGIDDILIGADGADRNRYSRAGESYVVFGSSSGFSETLDLADLDGANGFAIEGIDEYDRSGFSVSSGGDVNGDGIDDILIGAFSADPNGNDYAGESYVVFGSSEEFDGRLELATLNGNNGFVIEGIDEFDNFGFSVSSGGDVNGDGIDDILIGASDAERNGNYGVGESYVFFGSSEGFDGRLELATLNGNNGFVIEGIDEFDYSGFSVSSAGDVNGDGIDDILIGAFGADPNVNYFTGESYIVFGSSEGFDERLELAALDGSNGFILEGIDEYDRSGFSVSSGGDVNGDGIDDILIGAFSADPNGNDYAGESYVVFGSSEEFDGRLELATLNGNNGFVIEGIDEFDNFGFSVSSAGDVNGDGIDDILIGAPGASPNRNYSAGKSYVVFGSSEGFDGSLELATLDGSSGFILEGIDRFDFSGSSVSSAGDVNGDGIDDIIIGADGADRNRNNINVGESYVVFGTDTEPIFGTEADEVLTGTIEDDIIYGFDGADTIDGLAGNDGINAGLSIDLITAGEGNDLVLGDFGNDTIFGNEGDDRILGNQDNDLIEGGSGLDILSGNRGNDTIFGNEGSDRLIGGFDDDFLEGGSGSDRVTGGSGNDTLIGVDLTSAESDLGRGERDILVANRRLNSRGGSDTFILGNENGVFYDDGNSNTVGEADLARILGFDSANDTIQLSGSAESYSLELITQPVIDRTNARIFYTPESEAVGELIANVIDVNEDLSLDDPAFTFV